MKKNIKIMKRVLFIGGGGFIGSNIIKELNKVFGESQVFVMEPPSAPLHRLSGLNVKVYRALLNDLDEIVNIIDSENIEVIVHLVSTINPGSSYDDYKNEFLNVIFPTIKLMELCCEKNVKFIYFSSGGTVYGNSSESNKQFKESDIMAPISYYGWSKQMMENSILFMNRTRNLKYLILRPSNPYGLGQNLKGNQGLISVVLGRFLSGDEVEIWGDGSAIRDYIYIDDLSHAVCDLLCHDNVTNKTFNIGSGVGHSVNDVIGTIRKLSELDGRVRYISSRSSDVSSVVLNCNEIKKYIHFEPRSLKEGLKEYIELLKHGK